jgi:hypothetical protein
VTPLAERGRAGHAARVSEATRPADPRPEEPRPQTQAELRAERVAEEEGLRPSLRLAMGAAGVWLAIVALLVVVMPSVAAHVGVFARRVFVPTLELDLPTVVVCALFLSALVTVRAPVSPGVFARDFVRLAFGLGLATAVTIALQVATAFVVGGPTRTNDVQATALIMVASLLGVACGLGLLGLGLLWVGMAHEVAVLPRGELADEVPRVAHLAAPGVVAVVLWTTRYAHLFGSTPLLVIPPHAAAALTLSGAVVVLALWLRLRRPPAYGRLPE